MRVGINVEEIDDCSGFHGVDWGYETGGFGDVFFKTREGGAVFEARVGSDGVAGGAADDGVVWDVAGGSFDAFTGGEGDGHGHFVAVFETAEPDSVALCGRLAGVSLEELEGFVGGRERELTGKFLATGGGMAVGALGAEERAEEYLRHF